MLLGRCSSGENGTPVLEYRSPVWWPAADTHLIGCSSGGCSSGENGTPVLEYRSPVWWPAADTHLKPLDRVVNGACLLTGGGLDCDLAHRRSVAVLCMLYKQI